MNTETHEALRNNVDSVFEKLTIFTKYLKRTDEFTCVVCDEPVDWYDDLDSAHDPDDGHDLDLGRDLTSLGVDSDSDTSIEGQMSQLLDEYPLEIVYELGEPFTVIISAGGPHVEITNGLDGRDCYVLVGHWGTETVMRRGDPVATVAAYLRDMAEQYG